MKSSLQCFLKRSVTRDPRISCHSVACQAREEQEGKRCTFTLVGNWRFPLSPKTEWTLQATAATALIFLTTLKPHESKYTETGCCGEQTRKTWIPSTSRYMSNSTILSLKEKNQPIKLGKTVRYYQWRKMKEWACVLIFKQKINDWISCSEEFSLKRAFFSIFFKLSALSNRIANTLIDISPNVPLEKSELSQLTAL